MVTNEKCVSHYRILEELGHGGMGIVYRAEDTKLHRQVALKFLPEGFTRDRQALERFHREAYAASALNHPNICTIHDIDEHEGQPFIAMELLEGQTLKQILSHRPLTRDEVLDLTIQITEALEAAHAKGIIHRDIKPANIMVGGRGQVKVLDFGLAKLAHEGATEVSASPQAETAHGNSALDSLTRAGTTVGTPAYMSPEQVACQNLDGRTDLFSLGLVLYEMATRRRAFEGESSKEVIEKVLVHIPPPPSRTHPEWPPAFDEIVRKLLEKDRELRYQTAADLRADLRRLRRDSSSEYDVSHTRARVERMRSGQAIGFSGNMLARFRRLSTTARLNLTAAIVLILALGFGLIYWRTHRAAMLTEKDAVLLTDFVNTTGDSVFDDILKQALTIKLNESPFLNIFPENRVREALSLMGRSPDERVTASLGREICARQGIKAIITGQIASLGSNYVITLDALNSRTGESLGQQQVEATSKEGVLAALGAASTKLRGQMGESLSSIERFDTPIQQATTSSLEAFTSYNLGVEQAIQKGSDLESIPFLKRAVEMDPNFAMAYSSLASRYANLGEGESAAEYARKAFELRERASERERFVISARYYNSVTGEVDKEIETCLLWKQLYPRDSWVHTWLGVTYGDIGQYEKAMDEYQEEMRLAPDDAYSYFNLGWGYLCLNRFGEARAIHEQALARNFDPFSAHKRLYLIAFVEGDHEDMRRHADWAVGRPEEYEMLTQEARTAAYFGGLQRARSLLRKATDIAERTGLKDNAAEIVANQALIEASFGNPREARSDAARAMALARTRNLLWAEAAALGVLGDSAQAEGLVQESTRRFPKDTLVNSVYLPFLHAGLDLHRGDPAQAIKALEPAIPYERAYWQVLFLRGQAYLKAGEGREAAAQFKKMMEYRGGNLVNHPWQALAHLYLGRAWVLAGDRAKARRAYQDFLGLWKDADPDIPILKQARNEYARLK